MRRHRLARPTRIATALVITVVTMLFLLPLDALAQVSRTGLCAWHVEFCKYRGLYRQVGVPFLILSAITLTGWLAVRLYRHRVLGQPLSARREILLLTAVIYLVGLATLTLTPNRGSSLRADPEQGVELRPKLATLTCAPASLPNAPNARSFCAQNLVGNVALFFPLGVFLALIWRDLRFRKGMQIAIALSLGIELLQYLSRTVGSYRSTDINDVILNSVGAALGLALASLRRWTA